jgi:hypothetical protein
MVYEWDGKRARRSRLARRGLGVLAAVFILAFPAWFAMSFGPPG